MNDDMLLFVWLRNSRRENKKR